MIHELLEHGAKNAKTGHELADYFGCSVRDITAAIERERREGEPICASYNSKRPGYFLAATPNELEGQIKALHKRASELYKTRRALIKTLKKIRDASGTQTEKE